VNHYRVHLSVETYLDVQAPSSWYALVLAQPTSTFIELPGGGLLNTAHVTWVEVRS
jgi:hypothetical protein